MNCYLWAGAEPESTDAADCILRANAASFSVNLMGQWVDFAPAQDGSFTGGIMSNFRAFPNTAERFVGPLALTVRLLP